VGSEQRAVLVTVASIEDVLSSILFTSPFDRDSNEFAAPAPNRPNFPGRPMDPLIEFAARARLRGVPPEHLPEFQRLFTSSPEYRRYLEADAYWQEQSRDLEREYERAMSRWYKHRFAFDEAKQRDATFIANLLSDFRAGYTDAIETAVLIAIRNTRVTWLSSNAHNVHLDASNGILLVDFRLPDFDRISICEETKKGLRRVSSSKLPQLRDRAIYSLVLRLLSDVASMVKDTCVTAIAVNGSVMFVDKTTGHERTATILSILSQVSEVASLNIARVDPKAAFRALKGINSGAMSGYAPISPIVLFNASDRRVVEAREVLEGLSENDNIAAMDWEDFEHLIRELFEKEFASQGMEVKVTRASRDSGVDAIAFDPDPIRGGKFVIQAKRYTRTVDVSAVRDLFGTVQNEGANRGILVTTSKFGPDSYEFAKGKALTLLDGGNLLALLEKHGYSFTIDIESARRELREKGWL
jgi:restriction system protein